MRLKVLSWNIWIDGNIDEMKEFLVSANADIIGLQEVKDDDMERPIIPFLNQMGYRHVFMPVEKEWGEKIFRDGPAIFSKHQITSTESFNLSRDKNRGAVRADIKSGDDSLHVFSTHLIHTHQEASDIQNEQATTLLQVAPREKTIIMGDFNALPDSEPIRNMTRYFNNSDPSSAPTWTTNPDGCKACGINGVTVRLDYIFTSKDLRVSEPRVEQSPASDHLPISCVVEL